MLSFVQFSLRTKKGKFKQKNNWNLKEQSATSDEEKFDAAWSIVLAMKTITTTYCRKENRVLKWIGNINHNKLLIVNVYLFIFKLWYKKWLLKRTIVCMAQRLGWCDVKGYEQKKVMDEDWPFQS